MGSTIYVAGLGVISAIGNNVAEHLASFEREEAGMRDISHLDTIHRNKLPVAEVKLSNEELAARAGLPADMSRTASLSLIAAREALNDAAIPRLDTFRTGFVSANT